MTTFTQTMAATPAISITPADLVLLDRLAGAAVRAMPDVAAFLGRELDRATVLPAGQAPADLVRLGSTVTFRDGKSRAARRYTLVTPDKANLEQGRLSVLTHVGAALIGLSAGQSIAWHAPNGEARTLTVLKVDNRGNAA